MKNVQEYRDKRDFLNTPEPKGKAKSSAKDIFVVQKHSARREHYDFRLRVNDVLKSWAIPKGMPVKQAEKRLAVETEDHPLEYAKFEGKIPIGQYGAGTVQIWDSGKYSNIRKISMKESYNDGLIEFNLKGGILEGNYALVKTRFNGNPKNWLIIKTRDDKYPFENG